MRPLPPFRSRHGKANIGFVIVCVVVVALIASSPQTVGSVVRKSIDMIIGAIAEGSGTKAPEKLGPAHDPRGPKGGAPAPKALTPLQKRQIAVRKAAAQRASAQRAAAAARNEKR